MAYFGRTRADITELSLGAEKKLNEMETDRDWYKKELRSEEKKRWELEEKVAELEVELEELLSAISAKSALSALPKQQETEGE